MDMNWSYFQDREMRHIYRVGEKDGERVYEYYSGYSGEWHSAPTELTEKMYEDEVRIRHLSSKDVEEAIADGDWAHEVIKRHNREAEEKKTSLVERARAFAEKAHAGQKRKGTDIPYITHPAAAAEIAASLTDDEAVVAAAWLHDTVEDTGVTMETLKQEFGEDVAALVAGNSEDKMEEKPAESTWEARKAQTIRDLRFCRDRRVKVVVFADKLANLRSLCKDYSEIGDKLWERFNQKDPGKHRFYYGSVMLNCTEFVGTKAFREYRELMDKTFGKYDPVNFMEDCTVLNIPMSVKNKPRPEDAELLVDIGYTFEHGTCFVENRDTARQFYSLAIERGSKTALNNMGHLLMNDPLATKADIQTAVRCLKSAVNAGIPQAMVNLGTLYQNGAPGLEPDAEKAFKLFRKAGRLGDDDGLFYYAFCLEFGIGTKQNREKAFPIFLDLYERGHSPAYIFVGLSYLYSWGTDTDYFKARGIFRMGAMAGDAGSYAQLGQMYEAGLGCSKDPHAAADCYLMAGALGDASGYTNYARLLEDGKLGEPDLENAAMFFRKAADAGDKHAMEELERLEKEEIE